jgi:hypothetical protein
MSYEVTAITNTTSAAPQAQTPTMREDRELSPYQNSNLRLEKAQEAVNGRVAVNSEAKPSATEVPAATTEETVSLSPSASALARKELKFRQQQEAFKKKEQALEAERAEIAELKALKAKLANKDYSGIEGLVKYDEYTDYLINKDSNLSPEQQEIRKIAAELEGVKSSQKEDISKRFEAAVNERRKAVQALVEKPEFSRIKKAKAEEHVVKHILDTWEHDNIDLSPEQAAKEVSEALFEKANAWKSILDEETAEPVESQKQLPPLRSGIKTLTNNMAAPSESKKVLKPLSQMSDTERYAEARRRAEEKLKQQGRL